VCLILVRVRLHLCWCLCSCKCLLFVFVFVVVFLFIFLFVSCLCFLIVCVFIFVFTFVLFVLILMIVVCVCCGFQNTNLFLHLFHFLRGQISGRVFSSQCISERNGLFVFGRSGKRLEKRNYSEANFARRSRSSQQSKSKGLLLLLI
jgi:hypothetical protein